MKPKKYRVKLSEVERNELRALTRKGKHSAAMVKRANILLSLDESCGEVRKQMEIAQQLSTTPATIYNVSRRYFEEGLRAAIERRPRQRPSIQPIATGDIEARIIALACSEPPEGRSRWTLRLLEAKVVELQIVPSISDNTIGRLLKKRHLSLT